MTNENSTPHQFLRKPATKSNVLEASLTALTFGVAAAGVVAGIHELGKQNTYKALAANGIAVRGANGEALNSLAQENDVWAGRGQVLARDSK